MNADDPLSVADHVQEIKNIRSSDVYDEMEAFAALTELQQQQASNNQCQAHVGCIAQQPSAMEMIEEKIRNLNLSQDQRKVINEVKNYLEQLVTAKASSAELPTPFKLLCTGGPGVGKSFLIQTITEMAQWFGAGRVVTTSYNGIAAVNVDGITLSPCLASDLL